MMTKTEEPVERLVANIPVQLKRRMAAALRGQSLKDLLIEICEAWLAEQEKAGANTI